MKNFVHETTGHEYFKKQNDRVLKKNSFNDNNRTLVASNYVLIPQNLLVLQLPISNKTTVKQSLQGNVDWQFFSHGFALSPVP